MKAPVPSQPNTADLTETEAVIRNGIQILTERIESADALRHGREPASASTGKLPGAPGGSFTVN